MLPIIAIHGLASPKFKVLITEENLLTQHSIAVDAGEHFAGVAGVAGADLLVGMLARIARMRQPLETELTESSPQTGHCWFVIFE